MSPVVVAVLAGGAGRRMGGDKPRRRLNGLRLLDHALNKAHALAGPVILVVRDPAQADGFAETIVLDAPDIDGPLAGLLAALVWAADAGFDQVLTLACDMPRVPGDLLSRLQSALTAESGVAVAASGGRLHPVCALWRTTAVPVLRRRADEGRLSLQGLSEAVGRVIVDWPAEDDDAFVNINTIDDLALAEAALPEHG
ncbi:MAG: molybdenum cofactor guanylyltransferase [Brevundimonas sp. 32-68-21]|jgi:molybdenum cofactor guanylyltransferase|uniref:Molybdenum cofactor guanylyltransferase n=1 Tax=Brevundimonas mediterranea TaxID=74329 RepID=A0A6G7EKZ1_9CAUL|nr:MULTISPECIES: molybdenum cofactor guanylyltransferase [Brevundimonas]OGN50030.1 MAG: hypothetical protein A2795_02365 [Caulobacterales bacterium RIFCSPHIGHO2_01_FULL_67_30]OYX81624.1 MAG: molybdenum cofactor guanylyltransferase [Brevundimonas sp. 32-68-21]EDX81212.1 hypothetical protein BBAL3_2369 [Brevundimonas sp. BAL3]MBA4331595.1 molybdenum cofactor guanylyltransferase [Brevundimonas sp.]QIH74022.1 molybdenum cofactor guanylyltransferase [Brevundimonas mediterranea]